MINIHKFWIHSLPDNFSGCGKFQICAEYDIIFGQNICRWHHDMKEKNYLLTDRYRPCHFGTFNWFAEMTSSKNFVLVIDKESIPS